MLRTYLALSVATVALLASPVIAAERGIAPASPLFADYWSGFLDHWSGVFKKQNGIILASLGVGALSLFIITRGKWRK